MILDIPYKSQLPYETGREGERKWCGIVSLWMVLSYYLKDKAPSVENLLEKYGEEISESGFQHKDFLKIARDFGLSGFRKSWWAEPGVFPVLEKFSAEGESDEEIKEWEETNFDEGIHTIRRYLNRKAPVIVSVNKDFSPSLSTHLVVITGYDPENLIIHDPLHKGPACKIKIEDFKNYWIRQAIIIKDQ